MNASRLHLFPIQIALGSLAIALALAVTAAPCASAPGLAYLPGDAALAPAAGKQMTPQMAASDDGFLAVWVDDRSAIAQSMVFSGGTFDHHVGSEWDIYAARLDADGDLIDESPIIVAQQVQNQGYVDVAWNGENWLVVFTSQEGMECCPGEHRFFARVSPEGVVLDDPPIRIEGPENFDVFLFPAVASSDGVNWAVVWTQRLESGAFAAFGTRIAPDGTVLDPSGVMIRSGVAYSFDIDLVFSGGQYFLVVAGAGTNGGRILGQRVSPDLTPIGSPVVVNPYNPTGALNFRVATDGTDYFVTWFEDRYDYEAQVMGARVTSGGGVLDPNGLALTAASGSVQYEPAVAWDGTNFVVVYYTYGLPPEEVFAVRVTPAGQVLDYDLDRIPVTTAPRRQVEPAIEHLQGGATVIAWRDDRHDSEYWGDIYATTFAPNGTVGADRCIALGAPRQTHLRLVPNGSGFLAVYRSETSPETRIAAQRIDAVGVAIDLEPVVVAQGGSEVQSPSAAWSGSEYLVVWENSTTNQTFGRRLAPDLTFLDPAPITLLPGNTPDVAAMGGVFLVVASYEQPHEIRQIYSQRVRGSDGVLLDPTARVFGASFSLFPRVTSFAGRWLAAWEQHPSHDDPFSQIHASFVTADGVAAGAFVASGRGAIPSVAAGPDQALIAYQGSDIGTSRDEIFASRWSPAGTLLGPYPLQVTAELNSQFDAAIAWTGDGYAVAFGDYRNDDPLGAQRGDLYGSRIDANGVVLDPDGFAVANDTIPEMFPHVAADGSAVLLGGSVFRQDPGYVAYRIAVGAPAASTGTPVDPGDAVKGPMLVVSSNPLFGQGTISFRMAGEGTASVRVFDTAGREVRRLLEGPVPNGTARVVWDLRDESGHAVNSGVYFLRARTPEGASTVKVAVVR